MPRLSSLVVAVLCKSACRRPDEATENIEISERRKRDNAPARLSTGVRSCMNLRPFQQAAVDDGVSRFLAAKDGDSFLYAGPTGVGKSLVLLGWQQRLTAEGVSTMIVTPRLEIIGGMLDKLSIVTKQMSTQKLADVGLQHGITTPIRFRNALARGDAHRPDALLLDEAHHSPAMSWEDLRAYLPGVIRLGVTATPYRGTPKGTAEFLRQWNDEVTWMITLREAVAAGYVALPNCSIWPIVDDDQIEITNGEIKVSSASEAYRPRLEEIAQRVYNHCKGTIDRPTMFSLPTTESCYDLLGRLKDVGLPAVVVVQDTSRDDRVEAFRKCIDREALLIQIDVISEGVDLPIRRLIDLRPTMSPVKWLQQVGRITRPIIDEPPTEYICTNRNLERFAYLLEGFVPPRVMIDVQTAFDGKPSTRSQVRAIGMESVGRFKPAEIELADGCIGSMYSLYSFDNGKKIEWAVLLHPSVAEPLVATRTSTGIGGEAVQYGRWRREPEMPLELSGFQSSAPRSISDKQKAWWLKSAAQRGLKVDGRVTTKTFPALPVLNDTRCKFAVGGW